MSHRKFTIILFILYIFGMTAAMIWQGIGLAPDRYALVLLLGSLLVKRTRRFLLDWLPFLSILISYDFLRGFADNLNTRVNFLYMINFDKALFGALPTAYLQNLFYTPNHIHWYDIVATIFYFIHFAMPLSFGFLLWLYHRERFKEFTIGILLLSYAGWISYVVFPAAPPWLAQDKGYIHGVTKIMDHTFTVFPERLKLPTIYHKFNPNPVAAMPSMHAAYALFIFYCALRYFKKRGWVFVFYPLIMWVSIVYLGEHYAVDVLLGAVYATLFFLVAKRIASFVKLPAHKKETELEPSYKPAEVKAE